MASPQASPFSTSAGTTIRMATAPQAKGHPFVSGGYPSYESVSGGYPSYETAPLLEPEQFYEVGSYLAEPVKKAHHRLIAHLTMLEKISPYSCEFFGTFLLTFTVITVTSFSKQGWGATAIAFAVMALVYSMGPMSGGHFNPAVSLACALTGKVTWWQAFGYMFCQYWGGLFAGLMCHNVFYQVTLNYGPLPGYNWFAASLCEAAFTALLCFVLLSCLYSERTNPRTDGNQFYALAIGFVVLAGGYASGDISGGIFNPCVALGVQMMRTDDIFLGFEKVFQYAFSELLGACIGAFLYFTIRIEEFEIRGLADEERESYLMRYIPSLGHRLLAEFLGTFVVVFTFCVSILMKSSAVAWSTGAIVMSMTYSLSNVSGAHFNPAVTLAVMFSGRRKLPAADGLFYMLIQLLAGCLAGAICSFTKAPAVQRMPTADSTWGQVFAAELIFTFILAYVMLACSTAEGTIADHGMTRQNFYHALAIGACYIAGGIAIAALTGGSINPAITIGLASATASLPSSANPTIDYWASWLVTSPSYGDFLFYTVFQLCGAGIAAFLFHITHAKEYGTHLEMGV
mmetsp:Transcript_68733/g.122447  ORF Transcript_68733/g.122447 Transcript_68733/m.122447 type:complete len:571 (+) Transcript_68733:71-1783(+)